MSLWPLELAARFARVRDRLLVGCDLAVWLEARPDAPARWFAFSPRGLPVGDRLDRSTWESRFGLLARTIPVSRHDCEVLVDQSLCPVLPIRVESGHPSTAERAAMAAARMALIMGTEGNRFRAGWMQVTPRDYLVCAMPAAVIEGAAEFARRRRTRLSLLSSALFAACAGPAGCTNKESDGTSQLIVGLETLQELHLVPDGLALSAPAGRSDYGGTQWGESRSERPLDVSARAMGAAGSRPCQSSDLTESNRRVAIWSVLCGAAPAAWPADRPAPNTVAA